MKWLKQAPKCFNMLTSLPGSWLILSFFFFINMNYSGLTLIHVNFESNFQIALIYTEEFQSE